MASKAAIAITTRVMAMSRSMRLCWGDCRLMLGHDPPRRPRRLRLSDSTTAKMCCRQAMSAFYRAPCWSAATCDDRGKRIDVVVVAFSYNSDHNKIQRKNGRQSPSYSSPSTQGNPGGLHSSLPNRRRPADTEESRSFKPLESLGHRVDPRRLQSSVLTAPPRSCQPVYRYHDHPRNRLPPLSTAKFLGQPYAAYTVG
jgi:hypothetical protein